MYEANIAAKCKYNVSQNAMTGVGPCLLTLTNTDLINQYNVEQIQDLSKELAYFENSYNDEETLVAVVKGITVVPRLVAHGVISKLKK